MNSLVTIQHWLYGGTASGLGDVAGGDARAIFAAMAAAILFGATVDLTLLKLGPELVKQDQSFT